MNRSTLIGVRGFRSVISGLMVSLVAVALLVMPAPAQAAGGGCQISTKAGFQISSCSADNGVKVFGDFYVNVVGPIGPTGCSLRIEILDVGHGDVASRSGDPCNLGHHLPALEAPKVPGHTYRTVVRLNVFVQNHYFLSFDTY